MQIYHQSVKVLFQTICLLVRFPFTYIHNCTIYIHTYIYVYTLVHMVDTYVHNLQIITALQSTLSVTDLASPYVILFTLLICTLSWYSYFFKSYSFGCTRHLVVVATAVLHIFLCASIRVTLAKFFVGVRQTFGRSFACML